MEQLLTEPCNSCRGSGLVPRERCRLPNGELDPRDTLTWPEVICEACNGSGRIAVRPETIEESATS